MQVILLERIRRLGQMGDVVTVKDGYARNFLLPQKKAMRATKGNMSVFETQRAQLETRNLEQKSEAEKIAEKLTGKSFIVIRQAGDTGQLYGSVSTRDIGEAITADGFSIDRKQVLLEKPIKALGVHALHVQLHPEVEVDISVNVARSDEEAERQARGEDVTVVADEKIELETFSEDDDHLGDDHLGDDHLGDDHSGDGDEGDGNDEGDSAIGETTSGGDDGVEDKA